MTTEKKHCNFTLNNYYLLYTSKSIYFSHIFVYYRSIVYSMLLRFLKVKSAVIEMIMFFGFSFGFGFFLFCPPLHLTPVGFNSPFPIITQKLSKIFSNTERRKLCSVRYSSWVTTAANVRGEGTVVAGRAYLLRCTSDRKSVV